MMDLNEINNTITELQNGKTTFDTCQKLASLFIVREYLTKNIPKDDVVLEYHDILPSYSEYVEHKKNYQLDRESIEIVEDAFKTLLQEIYEFLDILYVSTENTQERASMMSTIDKFIQTHN